MASALAKPGYELLALHGNCSIRTARRIVGRFIARGYVKVDGRPGPGRRTVYLIPPMPGAPGSDRPSERRPQPLATDDGSPKQPNGGQLEPNGGHLSAERWPIPLSPPEPNTGTLDPNPSRATRRTTRNRSRVRAAATADDDDFDSLCDKLGAAAEAERELIRRLANQTGNPAGYVRRYVESDGGESFMRYVRRVIAEQAEVPP